jgi:Phage integrase, N-terminal SAM-like domain
VTHLRQIMLEELRRRNYAESTIDAYIHTVEHFSRHFHRSPDQLGPEHIRQYQAALFTRWKLAPNTVTHHLYKLSALAMENRIDPYRSREEPLLFAFRDRLEILTDIHPQPEVSLIARRNCGRDRL